MCFKLPCVLTPSKPSKWDAAFPSRRHIVAGSASDSIDLYGRRGLTFKARIPLSSIVAVTTASAGDGELAPSRGMQLDLEGDTGYIVLFERDDHRSLFLLFLSSYRHRLLSPSLWNPEVFQHKSVVDCSHTFSSTPLKLSRKLGSGSTAEVACHHSTRGRLEAAKCFDKLQCLKNRTYDQLFREISILRTLHHPSVIQLYEVVDTPSHICLLQEYMYAGDVQQFINLYGHLSEVAVAQLFHQLCAAVHFCHTKGVAHRDIKLENMLLHWPLQLKLADFGLSSFMDESLCVRGACGSYEYAAPEVLRAGASGRYSAVPADCWSMGVVLFTLCCHSLPFSMPPDGDMELQACKLERGISVPGDTCSAELRSLMEQLLAGPLDCRSGVPQMQAHAWMRRNTMPPTPPAAQVVQYKPKPLSLPTLTPKMDEHIITTQGNTAAMCA